MSDEPKYPVIYCDWLKTQIGLFTDKAMCLEVLGEDEEYIPPHTNAQAGYSESGGKPPLFYMYFGSVEPSDRSFAGLVAHEATHLVQILLHYKGIETSHLNQEVVAHMIEWLVCEVLDRFGLDLHAGGDDD